MGGMRGRAAGGPNPRPSQSRIACWKFGCRPLTHLHCLPPCHAGLLDSLGVQSVIAVGHSAGALVCMELAQRQPQRVAGKLCAAAALWRPVLLLLLLLLRCTFLIPLPLHIILSMPCVRLLCACAGLGFVAPALPTTPENSFARRATLGSQLRFLAIRGLLGDDTLGLR